jgi:hypothetical protein
LSGWWAQCFIVPTFFVAPTCSGSMRLLSVAAVKYNPNHIRLMMGTGALRNGLSRTPYTGADMRTVVFHQGALGDFLIAASAIDELAEVYGWEHVDFWSKPQHVSLLTGRNYPGECHPAEGPLTASLFHDSLWRATALPEFLLDASRILIFGQAGSRLLAERLSERLSARVDWIQSFPKALSEATPAQRLPVESDGTATQEGRDARMHVSEFLRMQLNGIGLPISGRPLILSPPDSEKDAAAELLRRMGIRSMPVFIHPGSGSKSKVWPLRNWRALVEWLRLQSPFEVLLSVGPADRCLDGFAGAMRDLGIPVVEGLSPLRLSALISLCSLYIGSDSGVSHLAAAVGIPAIVIFGPTDPQVWAPRGRKVEIVVREWTENELNEVLGVRN